jgi:hypothetical protein
VAKGGGWKERGLRSPLRVTDGSLLSAGQLRQARKSWAGFSVCLLEKKVTMVGLVHYVTKDYMENGASSYDKHRTRDI